MSNNNNQPKLQNQFCDSDLLHYQTKPQRSVTMIVSTTGKGEYMLFQFLEAIFAFVYPNQTKVVRRKLDSGDVAFEDDKTKMQMGAVIERKTVHDLAATIGSEREDQLSAMLNVTKNVFYLIEGNPMETTHGVNHKALFGRLNTLRIKWRVNVAKTDNVEQSALFLVNMHINLEHIDEKRLKDNSLEFGIIVNQVRNKKDNREDKKAVRTLMLVEGMSQTRAESIVQVYPSFSDLLNAYQNYKGDVDLMLAEVPHASEKSNKLGNAMSKAVADFFGIKNLNGINKVEEPNKRKKIKTKYEKALDYYDGLDDDEVQNFFLNDNNFTK